MKIVGANTVSVEEMKDRIKTLINSNLKPESITYFPETICDAPVVPKGLGHNSSFFGSAPMLVNKSPFWTLSSYMDFALFNEYHGYYKNSVNLTNDNSSDFSTQVHNGLSFAIAAIIQAYNTWKSLTDSGALGAEETFNIVEPGAGTGFLCAKLLFLIDRMDFSSEQDHVKNWKKFVDQIRIHLSDVSDKHVTKINKTLAGIGDKLVDKTLLDKVTVTQCSLQEIELTVDFFIIQEIVDCLPVDRVRKTKCGYEVATILPFVNEASEMSTEDDDIKLRNWLKSNAHNVLEDVNQNARQNERFLDIKRLDMTNVSTEQLHAIRFVEVFIPAEHYPSLNNQLCEHGKYYDRVALMQQLEKGQFLVRRGIRDLLKPLEKLRGTAIITDYGHLESELVDCGRQANSLRMYPQDEENSKPSCHGPFDFLLGIRKTKPHAYLIKPGKYDITSNVDFNELCMHLGSSSTPVVCGPQMLLANKHFSDLIDSMPPPKEEFLTEYQSYYYDDLYTEPDFKCETKVALYWHQFFNYVKANTSFRQLIVTNDSLADSFRRYYELMSDKEIGCQP